MAQHALTWGEPPTQDDRTWALIAHLTAMFTSFVGPLIILVLYQDKSPYIRYHALQEIVLQVALWAVLTVVGIVTCGMGFFFAIPLMFVPVWGAIKANEGSWQGYPLIENIGR